jgi:hypothetical protein
VSEYQYYVRTVSASFMFVRQRIRID